MEKEIKRSTNFSSDEVEFLLKIVDEYKDTIECKRTDRTSAEEKAKCWCQLESIFNCQFGGYRSHKTLKIKYENLKKTAKRNSALDRKEVYKTGGGPKPPSNVSAIDTNILKILQIEQVDGHESIYDDDRIEYVDNTEIIVLDEEGDDKYKAQSEKTSGDETKWDKYTPKMLRNNKHSALKTGVKRSTKDVWTEVALLKLKKIEIEIKVLEEEAKLRKTKLELEIEALKQKIGEKKCEKEYTTAKPFPKEF